MASARVASSCWSCCDCSWSMRMSAIICSCSRFGAAAAGTASNGTRQVATKSGQALRMVDLLRLLGGHDEMGPAVLRPGFFTVPGVERELLAVAHDLDAIGGDSERYQVVACGDGSSFAEGQIVLGGAALVAVALDADLPGRIPAQQVGIGLQHLLPLGVHFRQVEAVEHW